MIEFEYEMTYAETIEGPLGQTTDSPLGERLCWQVRTATLRGPRIEATIAAGSGAKTRSHTSSTACSEGVVLELQGLSLGGADFDPGELDLGARAHRVRNLGNRIHVRGEFLERFPGGVSD